MIFQLFINPWYQFVMKAWCSAHQVTVELVENTQPAKKARL